MAPLLAISGLDVHFGAVHAVRNVSLSIDEGEVLGLVGESGSGKSATALAIPGLHPLSATVGGQIVFLGKELLGLPSRRLRELRGSQIAMIFQEPMTALNPVMTIGRQIAEAAQAHSSSWTSREANRKAMEALESVGLPDAARRFSDYPHQFSGGQRQRILIAMALINKPKLLIADEPTTALDVTVQAQILDLLRALQAEHRLSMLFISHDLAVVGQVASRVAVMRHGEVVEEGSCGRLLTHPEHPYTKSLLAAVPTMRSDRSQPLAQIVSGE
jgi:peptide/nickel transport system ATP-binding protein